MASSLRSWLRRLIPPKSPTEREMLVAFMEDIERRSEGRPDVWITEAEWAQIGARVAVMAGRPPRLSTPPRNRDT